MGRRVGDIVSEAEGEGGVVGVDDGNSVGGELGLWSATGWDVDLVMSSVGEGDGGVVGLEVGGSVRGRLGRIVGNGLGRRGGDVVDEGDAGIVGLEVGDNDGG